MSRPRFRVFTHITGTAECSFGDAELLTARPVLQILRIVRVTILWDRQCGRMSIKSRQNYQFVVRLCIPKTLRDMSSLELYIYHEKPLAVSAIPKKAASNNGGNNLTASIRGNKVAQVGTHHSSLVRLIQDCLRLRGHHIAPDDHSHPEEMGHFLRPSKDRLERWG